MIVTRMGSVMMKRQHLFPAQLSQILKDQVLHHRPLAPPAQATIYYNILLPTSGIRSIVACDPYQDCDFCLDIDDDGVCTLLDYAIIRCENGTYGLDYMGAPDGECDPDVILIMDCENPVSCSVAQFCRDSDMNGICDEEGGDTGFL